MIDMIGYIASLLISIASFPQIRKSIKTKSSGDISWGLIALTQSSMLLWLIYSLYKGLTPLILSSSVTILGYIILSYLKLSEKGLLCKIGWHEWQYLVRMHNEQVEAELETKLKYKNEPVCPPAPRIIKEDTWPWDRYYKRTCTKCNRYEDTITDRMNTMVYEHQIDFGI